MTWPKYLSFVIALIAIKPVTARFGNESALIIVLLVLVAIYVFDRVQLKQRDKLYSRLKAADPLNRQAILATMSPAEVADAYLATGCVDPLDNPKLSIPAEFTYAKESRSLSTYLFWASLAIAVFLLMPLLVNTSFDLSSALILLGLALFLILNAAYYYVTYPWIGSSLRVDEVGLLETKGNGEKLLLRWRDVDSLQLKRYIQAVDYTSKSGQKRIRVWLSLADFSHFFLLTLIQFARSNEKNC